MIKQRRRTLYKVLSEVAEAIEASPQNYYQSDWACPVEVPFVDEKGRDPKEGEACGTAFCRAGWMAALTAPDADTKTPEDWNGLGGHIHATATRMLRMAGVDDLDISALFDGNAIPGHLKWGTKAYAKAGAAGVRQFQKEHAAELKRVIITPEGKAVRRTRKPAR
jgi:hypothetical protein